jgi:hypothetical protein
MSCRHECRLIAILLLVAATRAAHAAEALPPGAPPPALPPPGLTPTGITVEPVPPAGAPSGAAPLVAGALTAFVPFVIGCGLWSSNSGTVEKAGSVVMASGFAAAPWVSHGMQRRWKRAAIFGSISAASSAAMLIAMQAKDPFYAPYANRQRLAFGVFLTSAMFAAAVGVFDSVLAAPAREAP